MSQIDAVEIQKLLPHRYPFLLIDRIDDVVPGEYVKGLKNLTLNESFFNGHFPEQPVMPGVLMVEALAQLSGVLVFKTIGRYPKPGELFYFAGIDNVRFKRMVIPGDQLQLKVEFVKERRGLWKFKGEATVEGEVACTAEFMVMKPGDE